MFKNQINPFRVLITLVLITFLIAGCGGKKEVEEEVAHKIPVTYEEVPPGALPDVPAELGGEGFTGEGWQTDDDLVSFADPNAVKGGTFIWSTMELPPTTRMIGKDCNHALISMITGMIYQGMIGTDRNTLETGQGLATHWQISEDKRTFRFRLNPKARWADGSRVTTKDIIATWKLRVDPSILFPSTNITFGYYEEPIAESPYIVSVKTTELNWRLFLYFGGMGILPAKYISHLKGSDYLREYQWEMPPGSGPYELKMENINKGVSWTVTRRDNWWGADDPENKGTSNFDNIKFLVVPEPRLEFEKFKKGELDFYLVGRAQWWIEETDFDNIKRGLIQKRRVYNDEPQGISGLVFNMRKPPFDDIRMRKAMVYLWDRKKLIENLFYNEYDFMDSYYTGSIYENPNNPKYRYDPDLAIELLSECGYTNRNEQGLLVNANGNPLEFELAFTTGMDRIWTVFQQDLEKIGITLNLKETTPATKFKMGMERKFKIAFQSWTGLLYPNPETSWASWLADSMNTNNFSGLKDDRLDELLTEYNVCFDQKRRVEIIREIDGILMRIQPYALGWYGPSRRMLFWNKFGMPEGYWPRTLEYYYGVLNYWWIDPEKEKKLEEAKQDPSIQLEVGDVEVKYWLEWNEKHGRKYKSEF
ncbi:hypothetical protein K9N50_03010 [bacterium]|nr:hypothetical protein [bacterium]